MNTELILLIIITFLLLISLVLSIVIFAARRGSSAETLSDIIHGETEQLREDLQDSIRASSDNSRANAEMIGRLLRDSQNNAANAQEREITRMRKELADNQSRMEDSVKGQISEFRTSVASQQTQLRDSVNTQLDSMRRSMEDSMTHLREENARKLEEIRGTVDEKLQTTLEKRISESFRTVSEQLEKVYKGLGEMQTLAGDVGGLKKVLSGVKTRGILGEIQLASILEDILTPDQYDTNVATIPGSSERVEFAVKLPGSSGETIYLPIDSKFPGERYQQLIDAQESGDKVDVDAAYKNLEKVILSEAKDIASKYIRVPYTTNFGIMFLPFEGLYAEVVSHGMMERLQREFNINIAGPSTMAALLNSLQMGFRTLAIQKHSNEIFTVLTNVQQEFEKFGGVMEKMQEHLRLTSSDLEKLMGTRSNMLRRQLDKVQRMEDMQTISLSDRLPGMNDH